MNTALLNRMENLCARMERCRSQVNQKLRLLGADKAEAREIVDKLCEEGYIDETRFAKAFASDSLRSGHGRIYITARLNGMQVDREAISTAINQISIEEYLNQLQRVVLSKQRQLPKDEPQLAQELIRYAIGRGFEPQLVQPCVSQLLKKK